LLSGGLKYRRPLADIEVTFKERIFLPSGKRRVAAGYSAFPFSSMPLYSPYFHFLVDDFAKPQSYISRN